VSVRGFVATALVVLAAIGAGVGAEAAAGPSGPQVVQLYAPHVDLEPLNGGAEALIEAGGRAPGTGTVLVVHGEGYVVRYRVTSSSQLGSYFRAYGALVR
jgi:acetyl esterase/lipase